MQRPSAMHLPLDIYTLIIGRYVTAYLCPRAGRTSAPTIYLKQWINGLSIIRFYDCIVGCKKKGLSDNRQSLYQDLNRYFDILEICTFVMHLYEITGIKLRLGLIQTLIQIITLERSIFKFSFIDIVNKK